MPSPSALPPAALRRRRQRGLTLVELLVVLAIAVTLAAIVVGLVLGARQISTSTRARSDLALISQAIEQFQHHYGEYPTAADSPELLHQALVGHLGPKGKLRRGPNYIVNVSAALKDPDHPEAAGNYFVDPWGNPYQYVFFTRKKGNAPPQSGYVLFSFGQRPPNEIPPGRAEVVPHTSGEQGGVIAASARTAGIIYAGR